MRTNEPFHAFSHIAHRGRRMARSIVRSAATAIIAIACLGAAGTANAVTWTVAEIVQAIQQAQANGQPFDRLLAQKVQEELAKANFQIIEGNLVYQTAIPATRTYLRLPYEIDGQPDTLSLVDYMFSVIPDHLLSLGVCQILIPGGSLINARSSIADVTATFYPESYIGFKTNPSNVILSLGLSTFTNANTNLGFEWCGVVKWPTECLKWAKNPLCPPPVCLPDICGILPCCNWQAPSCSLPDVCVLPGLPKTVEESWTDWASAKISGKLIGALELTLNHSLIVADNTVTVGLTPIVSGVYLSKNLPDVTMGPVIPDIRPIAVPVPPFLIPHVDTSPALLSFLAQAGAPYLAAGTAHSDAIIAHNISDVVKHQLQAKLDGIRSTYFPITLQLPTIQDFNNLDPASQALVKWVLDYLYANIDILGEFALDVVRNNWTEVLYYVLTDNRAGLAQLFGYQALCPSIEQLKANMPSGPLYSNASGACTAVDARNPGNGPFYATPSCTTEIGFQPENFAAFCRESFTAKPNPLLGNAAAWPTSNVEVDSLSTLPNIISSKWSLSSSAQLAVGVEPIKNNHIPFVKRVNFRQAGNCALEMRVYKKDIAATNLPPLLWMHGGAWTYRSSGFLGMESLVSSYTEDNFVVFAPFYRLAGDKDGSAECRNATWENMVADVEAALDWVKVNGASLGAHTSGKIAVTGQSAGAHLAGWLMTHRANEVSGGLLVYPPTDLNDFLTRLQGIGGASFPPLSDSANTPYDSSSAQEIVETYLQLPKDGARTVDLSNPPLFLSENSFAKIVADGISAIPPLTYPPAFILHGTRDSLLTYSQSQVLCQAYGGLVNVDWSVTPDLRAIYACGDRSQLHLLKEADHAFEVCPDANIASACRAGSKAGALLLTDSLQEGRRWLLNNVNKAFCSSSGQWVGATLIENNNAGEAVRPQIAMDANGNAVAVWYQYDGVRYNILANRFTAGSGWGAATLIETDNAYAGSPQIAMDTNGNAIAVWTQYDGVRHNILVNRYTAGSGWGAVTWIETDNAGGASSAQIAMDANGNAIAVWYQYDGARTNIWATRYTASSGWGAATLIETDNAGSAYVPQIAMNANGNAVAVWFQSDGTRNNIWANRACQ